MTIDERKHLVAELAARIAAGAFANLGSPLITGEIGQFTDANRITAAIAKVAVKTAEQIIEEAGL